MKRPICKHCKQPMKEGMKSTDGKKQVFFCDNRECVGWHNSVEAKDE